MNVIIDEYNSGASVNKLCNKYKKAMIQLRNCCIKLELFLGVHRNH